MDKKNIIVTGSREWQSKIIIEHVLRLWLKPHHRLIEGDANGADKIAGIVANQMGNEVVPCPANWNLLGNKAGFIRNKYMLSEYHPISEVWAFSDTLHFFEKSKGTRQMIELSQNRNVPIKIITGIDKNRNKRYYKSMANQVYTFNEAYLISEKYTKRLYQTLSDKGYLITDVSKDKGLQDIGIDFFIEMPSGKKLSIEFKLDTKINKTGNFVFEVISDIEKMKVGGTLKSQSDFIMYLDTESEVVHFVKTDELRKLIAFGKQIFFNGEINLNEEQEIDEMIDALQFLKKEGKRKVNITRAMSRYKDGTMGWANLSILVPLKYIKDNAEILGYKTFRLKGKDESIREQTPTDAD